MPNHHKNNSNPPDSVQNPGRTKHCPHAPIPPLPTVTQIIKPTAPPSDIPRTYPAFAPGDWAEFSQTVDHLANTPCHTPSTPPLSFLFDLDAAKHTTAILHTYQYDVESYIQSQPNMNVAYGSESRPATDLDHLLSHHPDWSALQNNITHGIDYPLTPIEDDMRIVRLHQALKRGNHKLATGKANEKILVNLMTDNVGLGYYVHTWPFSCYTNPKRLS
eukprot:9352473-Ditylum_brightwellii.AAC.1